MKKISLAFTLLTSAILAGTAFADGNHGGPGSDGRDARDATIQVTDRRTDDHDADRGDRNDRFDDTRSDGRFDHDAPSPATPIFVRGPNLPGAAHGAGAFRPSPPIVAARWETLGMQRASGRGGMLRIALPARASYDQLRLVPSNDGVDIMAIELTYGRGRTEVVRPQADGLVALDLGRGKVKSIAVRYVNRGGGRDASIKILGKDTDARVAGGFGGNGGSHGRF